jgi:hypothetical protein
MASFFYYRERMLIRAEDGGFAVYYEGELQGLKMSEVKAHQFARDLAAAWAADDLNEQRECGRIARMFRPVSRSIRAEG